jgi:hypothetical protein
MKAHAPQGLRGQGSAAIAQLPDMPCVRRSQSSASPTLARCARLVCAPERTCATAQRSASPASAALRSTGRTTERRCATCGEIRVTDGGSAALDWLRHGSARVQRRRDPRHRHRLRCARPVAFTERRCEHAERSASPTTAALRSTGRANGVHVCNCAEIRVTDIGGTALDRSRQRRARVQRRRDPRHRHRDRAAGGDLRAARSLRCVRSSRQPATGDRRSIASRYVAAPSTDRTVSA